MRLFTWLRRATLLWAGLLVYSNVAMYERFSLRRPLVELASLAALFCSNCVPSLMIGPSDTFHRQLGLDFVPDAGYEFRVAYFDESNFTLARAAELTNGFTSPFLAKNVLSSLRRYCPDRLNLFRRPWHRARPPPDVMRPPTPGARRPKFRGRARGLSVLLSRLPLIVATLGAIPAVAQALFGRQLSITILRRGTRRVPKDQT